MQNQDFRGLHGSHYSTFDAKGRVSVPVRLRAALTGGGDGGGLMVTLSSQDPCILVFAPEVWEVLAQSLRGASPFDDEAARRKRFLFANACGCQLDRQGRILVPPPLRDHTAIGKDVIWLGVDDRAEIWDRVRWEEELRRHRGGVGA